MTEDLEVLKSNPAILRLYGQYVSLRKEGNKYVGLCKFHAEKSGSFTVFAKDQGWKCFGCGKTGDIFSFIQELDKISFKEAIEKVKLFVGGGTKWEQDKAQVEAVFKPVMPDKTYITFSMDQYAVFEKNLANSKEGVEWLAGRGISLGTAQRLHVGFTQDVKGKSGPDNKDINDKGWIVFPCIEDGKVVSIKYRSIIRKVFCKQPQMRTALFNTDTIDIFEPVLLAEGEVDSISLEQAGFKSVSLASASSYPTPEQKDMLMQASCVILAGDTDGAVGEEVMGKLWRDFPERSYLLKWPDGCKDANELLLKCKDIEEFKEKVNSLILHARTQPIPDVYSIQDVMMAGKQTSISDHPLRLRFPWPSVDRMAILLPGSILSVIATSTGMGKSTWVIQATMHGALKHNETVLNYQCEMSQEEVATMVAAQTLRQNRNFLTGESMVQAAKMLGEAKYYVGYNPTLSTVNEVLDLMEAAIRRLGITCCVLDHLHHVCRNEQNEVQALANAMQRIKRIATQYGVKFIVVGQPRKSTQQNRGKLVHLSDAKGSETFSSDATAFMAIHRETNKMDSDIPNRDIFESKTFIHLLKARLKGQGDSVATLLAFGELAAFDEVDYAHGDVQ